MDIMYMCSAYYNFVSAVVILVIMDIMYMEPKSYRKRRNVVILVIMDIMYMIMHLAKIQKML